MKVILMAILLVIVFPVSADDPKYNLKITIEFDDVTFKKAAAIEQVLNEKFPDAKIVITLNSKIEIDSNSHWNWKMPGT